MCIWTLDSFNVDFFFRERTSKEKIVITLTTISMASITPTFPTRYPWSYRHYETQAFNPLHNALPTS